MRAIFYDPRALLSVNLYQYALKEAEVFTAGAFDIPLKQRVQTGSMVVRTACFRANPGL